MAMPKKSEVRKAGDSNSKDDQLSVAEKVIGEAANQIHKHFPKADSNSEDDQLSVAKKVIGAAAKRIHEHFPKAAFMLDEGTERMLDALRRPTLSSVSAIARQIITEVKDSPELFPIAEFYEQTWRKVYFGTEQQKRLLQLLLPREFNVYLHQTAKRILGTDNRSEMFRILVALYAVQKHTVELVTVEVSAFKINDPNSSLGPQK